MENSSNGAQFDGKDIAYEEKQNTNQNQTTKVHSSKFKVIQQGVFLYFDWSIKVYVSDRVNSKL